MKRTALFLVLVVLLSGCATYKLAPGTPPFNKGYVAFRDGYMLPECTIGENKAAPDLALAKARFLRRRRVVEGYYKKMGYIENRFKMAFVEPAKNFLKLVFGVFRLPFVALADYRYEHNPEYRQKIDRQQEQKDAQEEARIEKLKSQLSQYVQSDLAKEYSLSAKTN